MDIGTAVELVIWICGWVVLLMVGRRIQKWLKGGD